MVEEKIVITNELSETEMLKMLAKHNINSFGLRFMNPIQFALRLLNENNIVIEQEILSTSKANAIYHSLLVLNDNIFEYSKSYEDAAAVNSTINSLRYLILDDEQETLSSKLKDEKGLDLIKIYSAFAAIKAENDLIDNIDLLRITIDSCKNFDKKVILLDEFELKPLEQKLIDYCCTNIEHKSFIDLFETKKEPKKIEEFKKCYGNGNQIEYIIDYVRKNNIPYDQVTIIDNGSRYNLDIINILKKYHIPFTNNCGQSIVESSAVNFLKLYFAWNVKEGYGAKGLKDFINSPFFDSKKLYSMIYPNEEFDKEKFNKVLTIVGNMKLNGDEESRELVNIYKQKLNEYNDYLQTLPKGESKEIIDLRSEYIKDKYKDSDFNNCFLKDIYYINQVEKLNNILSLNVEELLVEFCVIRDECYQLDSSAVNTLASKIIEFYKYSCGVSHSDLVNYIIAHSAVLAQETKEKCLCVCNINTCFDCLRQYNFFIGLDSSFPANPKENYLITDDEYLEFASEKYAPTSINLLLNSKKNYTKALDIASALHMKNFIVYAYFNDVEIKKYNYSSFLYDLYIEINGNKTIKEFRDYLDANTFGYVDSAYSLDAELIKEFNKNEYVHKKIESDLKYDPNIIFENKRFTASTFASYFDCPLNFYYRHILKLNTNEEQDQYTPIKANEYGNICHDLMEYFVLYNPSKEEFFKYGRMQFELYVTGHHCVLSKLVESKRREFEIFLENAFADTQKIKAIDVKSELNLNDVDAVYEYKGYKLSIGGRLDRLDILKPSCDGRLMVDIIDYKSGKIEADFSRYKSGELKDLGSIFETLLYSYILEKYFNYKVVNNRYIYTAHNNYEVAGEYDDYKADFENGLKKVMDSIINCDFMPPIKKKDCDYCKFKVMCMKYKEQEEE